MKVKFHAKKMTEPKVQFISLVERGANRLPFKILKGTTESQMSIDLDFIKVFKRGEKNTPKFLGVVVEKTDNLDEVKQELMGVGLSVEKIEDRDKTVFFRQAEGKLEGVTIIKMGDQMLSLVQNEMNEEQVLQPLQEQFVKAYEAVSKALASDDRSKIIEHMTELTALVDVYSMVPASAYQANTLLEEQAAVLKQEQSKETVEKEEGTVTEPEAPTVQAVAQQEPKAEVQDKPESVEEVVSKAIADAMVKMQAMVEKSVATLGKELSKEVSTVQTSLQNLDNKISEVETVAKAADSVVKKKVISSPPAGDPEQRIRKTTDDSELPMNYDSAYHRHRPQGQQRRR